ncbi:MAG: PTS sugar transporter subunit IIA [Legionellaceae bacterium]|nr:PTS sugar transporter subunit IIA [Legionellaceae bacterium]
MAFCEFLNKDNIWIDTTAKSKSGALLNMSKLLGQCHPELDAQLLFNAYWERERLGSTTLGHGTMIPHVRLQSIEKTYGCFMKLQKPIDFEAEDKQPVDLIFGLVVPFQDGKAHLATLSKIVKQFSDPYFRIECRQRLDQDSLCAFLIQSFHSL